MSFTDPIATAIVEIEPVANSAKFQQAANQAAQNFNNALQSRLSGAGGGVNAMFNNIAAGFKTLGQAIGARLPSQVTSAANAISSKLGSAFGTVKAGLSSLNSSFGALFTSVQSGAAGAAIAIGTIILVVAKLTKSFAEIADGFRQMELGLRAVIENTDTANISAEIFIQDIKDMGAALGISSVQLGGQAQQLLTLGISGQMVERVLNAVTQATARTGGTAAQAGRALSGLTQIVSKGTLQMEELRRQIAGNLPGALNLNRVFEIIGESLGITAQQARDLQEQGLITAEQALPAITQAMEELNAKVDVFALRASTLSGLFGILRENFNQIIGTAFQPFIETLLPAFKGLIDQVKAGTGPFQKIREDIERFGKVVGETLLAVLQKIIPIVPKLFHVFVNLTQALGPLIVDMVDIGATILNIVIPVINFLAVALDVILNKIPILSNILRFLAAAVLTGGIFRAFALFGRALGSIGGLIGRIATPVSKLASGLAKLAKPAAQISLVVQALRTPIEAVINFLDAALEKVGALASRIANIPGIKQIVGAVSAVGGAIGDAFSDDNADKVSKTFEPIPKATADLVDMTAVLNRVNEGLKAVVDKQEALIKANDKVAKAEGDRVKALKAERDARDDIATAVEDEQEAKENLSVIDEKLVSLAKERADLIADTARDIREITKAQLKLEDIGFKLLDIEAERVETLEKIKELQTGATADELARADNKITLATLALNDAKQEELDLLLELQRTQEDAIDLSGLSLDQLRTTLAGLRAQAAAQRAAKGARRTEADVQRDLAEAQANVVDAQLDLNEAVQERLDLDLIVIQNATEIEDLTRHLAELENDKKETMLAQVEAQIELNKLNAGETERAGELLKVEEKIRDTIRERKDAVLEVRDAGIAIKDAEEKARDAAIQVRDVSREIRDAKIEAKIALGEFLGDELLINEALQAQITNNGLIIGQKQTLAQLALGDPTNQALVSQFNDPNSLLSNILKLPLNDPLRMSLLQLFASRFTGFAEGGVIKGVQGKMGRMIRVGEYSRDEMVLPLQSGPAKVWQMLSQNLPKYPALQQGISAVTNSEVGARVPLAVSSAKRIQNRDDGPATFGQLKQLINILSEHKTEVHVEAPITVESTGTDELLLRKLERRIERNLLDKLRRR